MHIWEAHKQKGDGQLSPLEINHHHPLQNTSQLQNHPTHSDWVERDSLGLIHSRICAYQTGNSDIESGQLWDPLPGKHQESRWSV